MTSKLFLEMSWEEFYERYTQNYEEFNFIYKGIKIVLCYGNKGSFSYNLSKEGVVTQKNEFSTPFELLNSFKIEGKTLKELYEEFY